MDAKNTEDAAMRVPSNIDLHCRFNPTKNPVLPMDSKFPSVYGMANLAGLITTIGTYIVDMHEQIVPSTKKTTNPTIRCWYDSSMHGHGFSVVVVACSTIPPVPNGILAHAPSLDTLLVGTLGSEVPLTFLTRLLTLEARAPPTPGAGGGGAGGGASPPKERRIIFSVEENHPLPRGSSEYG